MRRLTADQNFNNGYIVIIVVLAIYIYDLIKNLIYRDNRNIVAVIILDLIIIALCIALIVYLITVSQNSMTVDDYYTIHYIAYAVGVGLISFRSWLNLGEK